MKISVALAIYNGELYIKEQLESILNQTVPVNEIIVSDDGSSDATLEIINALHDPRIKIITGNPKIGYCGNFEYALKHTTGDIIFLADQDDIWHLDKVEQTKRVFEDNPEIELVLTDATLIDKNGAPLPGNFSDTFPKDHSFRLQKKDYLSRSVMSCLSRGMCMCIGRNLFDTLFPFPDSKIGHDYWIAFCAMNRGSAYFLSKSLVKYRIHDSNTSMKGNIPLKKRFNRLLNGAHNGPYDLFNMACAMLAKMDPTMQENRQAILTATQLRDDHLLQIEALEAKGIKGSIAMIKLRRTNALCKSNSLNYWLGQLYLTIFGKRYQKKHPRTRQQL